MRLLLAGGGTGGHLFPAVALARELLDQEPQSRVLFVGTARGLEQRLLPKLGLPLATLDMVGMVGRGWRGRLQVVPKLGKSLVQSWRILNRFRPDLVIGVGGYASVPLLLAALCRRIPCLIHEQNAVPGVSNRLLGRFVGRICLSFPDSEGYFPAAKAVVTGNPLRQELETLPARLSERDQLLIFGGSRGAAALNRTVSAMLPVLADWKQTPGILHQTGEEDFQSVRDAYRQAGFPEARVVPFIEDMAQAYRDATLVVCRAGATTLAELTTCGRPAILVPFPHATGGHQMINARTLEKAGAARVIDQANLTPQGLAKHIEELLGDRSALQEMADRGRRLGMPGAARRILDEGRTLLGRSTAEA